MGTSQWPWPIHGVHLHIKPSREAGSGSSHLNHPHGRECVLSTHWVNAQLLSMFLPARDLLGPLRLSHPLSLVQGGSSRPGSRREPALPLLPQRPPTLLWEPSGLKTVPGTGTMPCVPTIIRPLNYYG